MKGAGDVEVDGAQALGLGFGARGIERVGRAGEHGLAGRVVVGDAHAVRGGELRRALGRGAEQGEHRAAAGGLAGGGHVVGAQDDEAQGVVVEQRAGGGQGGELAERMAGQRDRVDVAAHARPARQRGAEDRGLREARGLLHAGKGVLTDELDRSIEQIGTYCRHEGAHIRGLAALSGEQDGGGAGIEHANTVASRVYAEQAFPPGGGCIGSGRGGRSRRLRARRPAVSREYDRIVSSTPPPPVHTFFDAIGGEPAFRRIVARFFEEVAADPILRAVYTDEDLGPAEERLRLFLMQYWGGPTTYSDTRGHPRLRMRHHPFRIGLAERDAWLRAMGVALDDAGLEEPHRARLWEYLESTANHMINAPG